MPNRRVRVQAPKIRRDNGKRERIPSRITPPKYNRAEYRYLNKGDND